MGMLLRRDRLEREAVKKVETEVKAEVVAEVKTEEVKKKTRTKK